jgi:NADH-quinone oxidoreductase subunit L
VYAAVLAGVFITALYSFRMYFLVFHGEPRMDAHTREHLHETPWVVTGPLIALAIPSVLAGYFIDPVVFGDWFSGVIHVAERHDVLGEMAVHYHGPFAFVLHAFGGPAIYLAIAGVVTAWYIYMKNPQLADNIRQRFNAIYQLLVNKYYADDFNETVFAGGARGIGQLLWRIGDVVLIDGLIVNGSARVVGWTAGIVRRIQTGHLYTYAFSMIIGLLLMLFWFVFRGTGGVA